MDAKENINAQQRKNKEMTLKNNKEVRREIERGRGLLEEEDPKHGKMEVKKRTKQDKMRIKGIETKPKNGQ